ncbi:MAG: hypothetical protein GXO58_00175 [Thermodesulfobacteria bacterium]|nr:hypothetical protein [Thermodesulfobacteriota bacterium]
MKIENDTVVELEYTLQVKDGITPPELDKVFRTQFLYGREPVIPTLEKAIYQLSPGDEIEITIPPEQGFGKRDETLVNEIPLSQLKHPEKLKEGQLHEEITSTGEAVRFLVKEIKDDYVVADFNHPAAGKELLLKAKILSVRAASAMDILRAVNFSRGGG